MLVHALVSNVQFDWKSRWCNAEDTAAQAGGGLFVAALREYALLRTASESEHTREGWRERAGSKRRVREAEHGTSRQPDVDVAQEAARVIMSQARTRGEADLLLMCCHHMSSFMPSDSVPCASRLAQASANTSQAAMSAGWWLRANAVRCRALARLLCASAATSPRGEELLRRVEESVQQLGNGGQEREGLVHEREGQLGGRALCHASPDQEAPNMLDVCLWALVLRGVRNSEAPGRGHESAVGHALSAQAVLQRLLQAILQAKVRCGHDERWVRGLKAALACPVPPTLIVSGLMSRFVVRSCKGVRGCWHMPPRTRRACATPSCGRCALPYAKAWSGSCRTRVPSQRGSRMQAVAVGPNCDRPACFSGIFCWQAQRRGARPAACLRPWFAS
jgi:hypothetical protein